ncbi:protein kinase domain-containing protein [Sorangium sp. So ce131]|uniref:serine/threonine-protein kinase n=1 Tax=Sorangium sp. So ce131 TaxID=3133282 RepID=UPI003F61F07E
MSRLPEPAPAALSFQFLAEIASGATTRVDLCRSVGPNRPGELLAVKRLHPHLAEDATVSTRFFDEVRTTAALKHPNVVEVAGWGTDEQGSYFAVELVQGVSLARLMKTVFDTGEVFPERLVVHLGATICRGLAAAHELRSSSGQLLNLVHRDLTPGNVLVGFQGEVKIADFGLAKSALRVATTAIGARRRSVTKYMAPEQARGGAADRRSDLFSFGVMLFELFAGKHPWPATSDYELLRAMATQPPADLRELRPKIDKELVAIVTRCLEKDAPARFQSADEILARLDGWLRSHGYHEGNEEALGRFVRRNAMRQMRWFERAVSIGPAGVAEAPRPSLSGAAMVPRRAPLDPRRDKGSSSSNRNVGSNRSVGNGAARVEFEEPTDLEPRTARAAAPPSPSHREPDPLDEDLRRGPPASAETSDEKTVVVGSSGRGREGAPSAAAGGRSARGSLPSYGSITAADGDLPLPASPRAAPHTEPSRGAAAAPGRAAERDTGAAPPAPGTPEGDALLHAEVDRLTTEAIRLREEARFAVAHAERKLAMAKAAAHLSSMAAEAQRLAASSDVHGAARRLDDAHTLERAMHRVMSAPLTLSPEAAAGPVSWSGHEQHDVLAQLGLEHLASPAASQPPELCEATRGRPAAPAAATAAAVAAAPAIASASAARASGGVAPGAAATTAVRGVAAGADMPPLSAPNTAEAIQFQASLRPMLLGVPRSLALAVAAAAFAAFVLLAWFYS